MSAPRQGEVLYFNDRLGIGYLLDGGHAWFFHFTHFSEQANRQSAIGERLSYTAGGAEVQDRYLRAHVACGLASVAAAEAGGFERVTGEFDQARLLALVERPGPPLVFDGARFADLDLPAGSRVRRLVVFADCEFDKALFIGTHFEHSLLFPGCRFRGRFSLKQARVDGAVHCEGADFAGEGGVSFRGIRCQSLYLDFGVGGPDDMVWINEVEIPGNLTLGGRFAHEIQLLGDQDGRRAGQRSRIGRLVIGREYYASQRANLFQLDDVLRIHGLQLEAELRIEPRARLGGLDVAALEAGALTLTQAEIAGAVTVREARLKAPAGAAALSIQDCAIGNRLSVLDSVVDGDLRLDHSLIEKYCELKRLQLGGGLSVYNLHAGALLLEPLELLYGGRRGLLGGARFRALAREQALPRVERGRRASHRKELAAEYLALRRWLAEAGRLAQEDQAFYHMRNFDEPRRLVRWFFGGVFGWGVRLWNVVLSVVALLLGFAAVYAGAGIPPLQALVLSVQSFFNAFFGAWPGYAPDSGLALASLAESALGVLFVTVLVGAYMRKLLR